MIDWHLVALVIAAILITGGFALYATRGSDCTQSIRWPRIAVAAGTLALILALAGCATGGQPRPEPIIQTVEVRVPVDDPACAREAVARLGEAPAYPDTPEALAAAPNLFERIKLLLAARELRGAREAALTDALAACAR